MRIRFWRNRDRELDEEIRHHLDLAIREQIENGMAPADAATSVRRAFGNVGLVKEATRTVWAWLWFEQLLQDLRYALRSLGTSPGITVTIVLALALGIGASSAVFSVVKAALLTPLPYADPDRRVLIWSRWIDFDKTWLSDQEIVDYRTFSQTLAAIAGWGVGQQNLTGDGEPLRLGVGFVTANVFDVLGVRPLHGRTFTDAEDRRGGPAAAILGFPLWQSRYGRDPGIVGRTIRLDDVAVEVVGVMPEGFRLPTDFTVDAAEPTQLWRPMQMNLQNLQRGSHGYYGAGLLAPGQTAATATEELRAITQRLTEQGDYHPAMQFTAFAVGLDEEIRGPVRPALWLLTGAVAFLLLIACVNVANLLLVGGEARLRELSVRTALGAATARLVRQLFTESLVLAVAGAGIGLLLAAGALGLLVRVDPTSLPPLAAVRLDRSVVGVALILAVATTIVFSVAPAMRTVRINPGDGLRDGGQQSTLGVRRHRVNGALVVTEVALAVVLVIGAGLMIRSLAALSRLDLGFNPDGVLTMRLALPPAKYDTPDKVVGFYRQLLQSLRGIPGVEQAGVLRVLPLATTIGDFGLDIDGFVESPGNNAQGDWQIVSDGAFEAMGTRLTRGRWFTPADTGDTLPIAVVNETMARTYWKEGDALGGRIRVGSNPERPWVTVVGIVADERHNGVTGLVKDKFYIPHSQWHVVTNGSLVRNVFLVARSGGEEMAMAGPIQSAIRQLDPSLPVASVRPMRVVVAAALATQRLTGLLLGAFAVLALALAAVGIYGVLSYVVSTRTHEIGIRVAIGAGRSQVIGMVLGQGLVLCALGVGVGLAGALGLTGLMRTVLYQVTPTDPLTFVAVPVILLAVAIAASLVPALRATRIPPTVALRME